MELSDMSDGEIVEDLSEISSEEGDYFYQKFQKLSERKLELELENSLALGQFVEKENRYSNRRQQHRPSPPKKKRLQSGSRYGGSRETTRNRSYRASSVFSHYSTIPKRRKERTRPNQRTTRSAQWKSSRKERRPRPKDESLDNSLGGEKKDQLRVDDIDNIFDAESSDDELLELRLNALKSKQEVKELIKEDDDVDEQLQSLPSTTEEENLRILALKSTLIKKTPLILERKKKKKLESERPYSPSDDVTPLALDDDAMVLSPFGSPFNEVEINEEIDMEISNSPHTINEEDDKESSDMDIAPIGSPLIIPQPETDAANEEELALRSMLLCSITHRKEAEKLRSPTPETPPDSGTESSLTKRSSLESSLKLAVQRLKQKEHSTKSGSKTIAMVLAEQQSKKSNKKEQETKTLETLVEHNSVSQSEENIAGIPLDVSIQAENFLKTIANDLIKPTPNVIDNVQVTFLNTQPRSPQIESDVSFSTITDTKNIPLIARSDKAKRSRLITSFDAVKRAVSPLVIMVNAYSDSDEESQRVVKKTSTRIVKAPATVKPTPKTSKDIESFLKQVRLQQEKSGKDKVQNGMKPPTKVNVQSKPTPLVSTKSSNLKHLPLSSQLEYKELLQKMKALEAKKARMEKRKTETPKPQSPKKQAQPKPQETKQQPERFAQSLRMIPQLSKEAQESLKAKAEMNYKTHNTILKETTHKSIEILDVSQENLKKQQQTSSLISILEKKLQAAKTNLNIINRQVKSNAQKIVLSQREIIKMNNNKERFGKICRQVGVMTSGSDYSLPDDDSTELLGKFKSIVEKTEAIIQKSTEQIVKDHLKHVVERIKGLTKEKLLAVDVADKLDSLETIETPCAKETQSETSAVRTEPTNEIPTEESINEKEDDESEVSKMIKESTERLEVQHVITTEETPEFLKQTKLTLDGKSENSKRLNVSAREEKSLEKKLKYESPLEFLRLPKNKSSSVNKIMCPFHLQGTCNNDKCQMMHI